MAKNKQDSNSLFNYNNIEKMNKNFMYQNLQKSKCFNSKFDLSKFDYVSFRGAHLKSCSFVECSFKGTEFIGSNLKGSNFRKAIFENAIFEGARLNDANFEGAVFINTIFVGSTVEDAKNLDLDQEGIRLYDQMPELEISDTLQVAVESVMANEFVKRSRTLDTKDKTLNTISLMILLEAYDEATLIKGFEIMGDYIDRDFYALSYITKLIGKLVKEEKI